jgi:hypothetical protein
MKDSYLSTLATVHNGTLLTNYLAITHPSQPNYIAMIGGSTLGITNDNDGTTSVSTLHCMTLENLFNQC